jgi:hypothetical protein
MKLLIMQFSPTSCNFIPLRSKYSPQHPVLKHPSLCSSLNVRDQVSHLFFLIWIVGGGIQGPVDTAATNDLLCQPRVIMMMEKLME